MDTILFKLRVKDDSLPVIKAATTLVVATSMLYFLQKTLQTKNTAKGFKEIPSPGGSLPFLGHMLALGSEPRITFYRWYQELGKIYKIKIGSANWFIINDPTLALKVLDPRLNASDRPSTSHSLSYSKGNRGIVFAKIGPEWKRARGAAMQVLSSGMLTKYYGAIASEAEYLAENLVKETAENGSVNPLDYLKLFTSNSVYFINLGTRATSVSDPKFTTVSDMVTSMFESGSLGNNVESYIPALSFINYFTNRDAKREKLMKSRDEFFTKLIEEADAKDGHNIMKTLREEQYNLDITDRIIVLSDIILAGVDTTAKTLNFILAILCRFPDAQDKIIAELDQFIQQNNNRLPEATEEDKVYFPYLLRVLREGPRYRNISTFGLPREMSKDEIVDGYFFPKGSAIFINMKALNRDSSLFGPDVEEFNPIRYTIKDGKIKEPKNFLFGYGKRLCPGMHLAETEMFYALTRIFSRCVIEPVEDKNGNKIYPDIDNPEDDGTIYTPLPAQYRFTLRNTQVN